MQAITTKYLPATNTKGARIKATCEAGSVTISYPYSGDEQNTHWQAAQALIAKLGWWGEYACAGDRAGNYFFAPIVRGVTTYSIKPEGHQERK